MQENHTPENTPDAGRLIWDTGMAEELTELVKASILAESGMSMLAQA